MIYFPGGLMNNQFARKQKRKDSRIHSVKNHIEDNSLERRNLEIKRRFEGLQIRRDHLERELEAVKNCLFSLDMQIKNDASNRQLFLRH